MISYNDNRNIDEISYSEIIRLCSDLEFFKKIAPLEFEKTKELIENIIFINENLVVSKPSIGLVLGGEDWKKSLNTGIKAYYDGTVNKLILSGGRSQISTLKAISDKDRLIPDAYKMKRYIEELVKYNQIPSDILKDIIMEPESYNTYLNIVYSLHLIAKTSKIKEQYFTLITSNSHNRRAYNTLKTILSYYRNELAVGTIPSNNNITDPSIWTKSLKSRTIIYTELLLLHNYAKNQYFDSEPFILKNKKHF